MKRELIAVTTMIPRMVVTSVFSDLTEFLVGQLVHDPVRLEILREVESVAIQSRRMVQYIDSAGTNEATQICLEAHRKLVATIRRNPRILERRLKRSCQS